MNSWGVWRASRGFGGQQVSIINLSSAAGGFTEQWVVFDGTAMLEKSTNLVANSKTGLIFFSIDFATTAGGVVTKFFSSDGGSSYVSRDSSQVAECVWRDTPGGAAVILMFGAANILAERANYLVALDTDGTSRIWVWREGLPGWSEQGNDAAGGGGTLDYSLPPYGIGARAGLIQPLIGNMSRAAMWTGLVVPDVTDSVVRDKFCDSVTGVLVDPAISVAAYGAPVFDFYGNAAAWNDASANHGTSTNWTMIGTVVDA